MDIYKNTIKEICSETNIPIIAKETGAGIDGRDAKILEKIKESNKKAILIINKIDLVKREKLLSLIDMYQKEYNFEAVIPISSLKEKFKLFDL